MESWKEETAEYFANQRDVYLAHKQHKYIEKYIGPSGNPVYVYDKPVNKQPVSTKNNGTTAPTPKPVVKNVSQKTVNLKAANSNKPQMIDLQDNAKKTDDVKEITPEDSPERINLTSKVLVPHQALDTATKIEKAYAAANELAEIRLSDSYADMHFIQILGPNVKAPWVTEETKKLYRRYKYLCTICGYDPDIRYDSVKFSEKRNELLKLLKDYEKEAQRSIDAVDGSVNDLRLRGSVDSNYSHVIKLASDYASKLEKLLRREG